MTTFLLIYAAIGSIIYFILTLGVEAEDVIAQHPHISAIILYLVVTAFWPLCAMVLVYFGIYRLIAPAKLREEFPWVSDIFDDEGL